MNNGWKITGCSKRVSKLVEEFLAENEMMSFIQEMSYQGVLDYIIYGYNPWDYLEETKLNMKYIKDE